MKNLERFLEIKERAIEGEKVDCSAEWNSKTFVEFKNDQFVLTKNKIGSFNNGVCSSVKKNVIVKTKNWLTIVEKLDFILQNADNARVIKN